MAMVTRLFIPEDEIQLTAVRAQGAGGQNVNKVASAVHLRFDIRASTLPAAVKARLLALRDQRITADGCVVIKAQRYRSQELNRQDALLRLHALVNSVAQPPKPRKPTQPTTASRLRRLAHKERHSHTKRLRQRVGEQ